MPPYTESGANTFACKVNGKIWKPYVVKKNTYAINFVGVVPRLNVYYFSNELNITAHIEDDPLSETIDFALFNVPSVGSYKIVGGGKNRASFEHAKPEPAINYQIDSSNLGMLTLTKLDTANHIISGKFYFDGKQTDGKAIIHTTEGQFDLKYK
jgi:hypothetical protein